jgi:hypothetical protein
VAVTGLNNQTADYTLTTADAGRLVTMSNTSARTITVPTNAAQPFATGAIVYLQNLNTGAVTISPASTVTVQSLSSANVLNGAHSTAMLFKRDTNTWTLVITSPGLR